MKSGTTFLHNLLVNHPEIKIIDRNMAHAYFDDDRIYRKGDEWYKGLFKGITDFGNNYVIGQTSADCAFNPGSIQRILAYNKGIKLIFVLRHPVDRAYSMYWHQYAIGREFRRFEHAIKKEEKLIKKSYYHFKHYSYLERSRYNKQFETVVDNVSAQNLLLLDFDSLIYETKKTVNAICDFLDVTRISHLDELNFANLPKNSAKIPSSHFMVQISAAIQNVGLFRVGRRLNNLFIEEKKPPQMRSDFRAFLEKELKNDINFYNNVVSEFSKIINKK